MTFLTRPKYVLKTSVSAGSEMSTCSKVDKLVSVEDVMKETFLTVDELVNAGRCWVKYEQTLMSNKSEKFEKLKDSLNLFYDKSGLFRSRTRIDRSLKLSYSTVNPILLGKESHFTKLIVLKEGSS